MHVPLLKRAVDSATHAGAQKSCRQEVLCMPVSTVADTHWDFVLFETADIIT
jgi:hypothetical protein